MTPKENEASLDDGLYDEFVEADPGFVYEYFPGEQTYDYGSVDQSFENGPRRRELREFLQNPEMQAPNLVYPKAIKLNVKSARQKLLNLLDKINKHNYHYIVKLAYSRKIGEKLGELSMLEAVKNKDDALFSALSDEVFGSVQTDVADYTFAYLYYEIQDLLGSKNPEIQELASAVHEEIFGDFMPLHDMVLVGKNRLIWSGGVKNHYFQDIEVASEIDEARNRRLGSQEIYELFTEALIEYGLKESWDVSLSRDSVNISTSQKARTIFIPDNSSYKRTFGEVCGLIVHEIGVHAKRRDMGEKSQLKLLGIGLDNYHDDEGVSTFMEQQVTGADDFVGGMRYLTTSLIRGADGGRKRNFREVFDIVRNLLMLYELRANGEITDTDSIDIESFNRCVRAFRGTSGKTPGACFTKDLLYRRENIKMWALSERSSPEMDRLLVGKYDPCNAVHRRILDELGY